MFRGGNVAIRIAQLKIIEENEKEKETFHKKQLRKGNTINGKNNKQMKLNMYKNVFMSINKERKCSDENSAGIHSCGYLGQEPAVLHLAPAQLLHHVLGAVYHGRLDLQVMPELGHPHLQRAALKGTT